jgi:hypothetical protein
MNLNDEVTLRLFEVVTQSFRDRPSHPETFLKFYQLVARIQCYHPRVAPLLPVAECLARDEALRQYLHAYGSVWSEFRTKHFPGDQSRMLWMKAFHHALDRKRRSSFGVLMEYVHQDQCTIVQGFIARLRAKSDMVDPLGAFQQGHHVVGKFRSYRSNIFQMYPPTFCHRERDMGDFDTIYAKFHRKFGKGKLVSYARDVKEHEQHWAAWRTQAEEAVKRREELRKSAEEQLKEERKNKQVQVKQNQALVTLQKAERRTMVQNTIRAIIREGYERHLTKTYKIAEVLRILRDRYQIDLNHPDYPVTEHKIKKLRDELSSLSDDVLKQLTESTTSTDGGDSAGVS